MVDRISVDIEGYREELGQLADLGKRTIAQQVELYIREGVERDRDKIQSKNEKISDIVLELMREGLISPKNIDKTVMILQDLGYKIHPDEISKLWKLKG